MQEMEQHLGDEPAFIVVVPRAVSSEGVLFCSVSTPSSPAWGWTWQGALLVTVHICQHQGELCFPLRYQLSFSPVFNKQLPPNNPGKYHASCLHHN